MNRQNKKCSCARKNGRSSFSNRSVTSPTSQLILQPFRRLPTSQLTLQPFRCFIQVTAHSPTLLSLLLRHRLFTYVTRRAARDEKMFKISVSLALLFCWKQFGARYAIESSNKGQYFKPLYHFQEVDNSEPPSCTRHTLLPHTTDARYGVLTPQSPS